MKAVVVDEEEDVMVVGGGGAGDHQHGEKFRVIGREMGFLLKNI